MAIFPFTFRIALLLAISLTQITLWPQGEAKSGGFSIELIHPSSRRSPASHSTDLLPELNNGAYLINFSIGTPPKFQLAVADSGSNINWIQCKPCVQCYSQHLPIFDPLNSSTYKALPCNSPKCMTHTCQGRQCTYFMSYVDQSYSYGDFAMEMFTFYSPQGLREISFPDILFGCAHRANHATPSPMITGIMGLGISPMSLISQISPAFGEIFFYCFVPLAQLDVPSTLTFGENAWAITGALFTPIIVKPLHAFYYLTLMGISVGGKRFDFYDNSSTISREGNIAIDSGTTMTVLPTLLYNKVKTAILQDINVEPIVYDNSTNICYKDWNAVDVPSVTMHFIAADVPLSKDNVIWPRGHGIGCLALRPTENLPFYGNVAQTNFIVGYDLKNMMVSFKATDCTKMA